MQKTGCRSHPTGHSSNRVQVREWRASSELDQVVCVFRNVRIRTLLKTRTLNLVIIQAVYKILYPSLSEVFREHCEHSLTSWELLSSGRVVPFRDLKLEY